VAPPAVSYELTLTSIERQQRGEASERYAPPIPNSFEDDRIRISWEPQATQLGFTLTNKTNSSLRVRWDDASYVGIDGRTDRIMHRGVKLVDRSESMPPTTVVRSAMLDDLVAPVSNTYFSETTGQWESRPLINTSIPLQREATVKVLLPTESDGLVFEYLFEFAVGGRTIVQSAQDPKSIRIVRTREEVAQCQLLGEISAHPPYIWPGDDFKQLRAKAAPLGADTVLVPGKRIGSVEGIAYRCARGN
jgi:hypothetical protein